jgi:hypothetical protein
MDSIILNSINVTLSSTEDKDYLNVKFILCDFNPNANNVQLNRATIDGWVKTLINKPIVGKIQGNNFTSHQYKNGKFGTDAFGVFTDVYIDTIDNSEYIIAEGMIWKRFEKACSIIENRISKGLDVASSWEVTNISYHMEGDIRVIDDAVFVGHSLLGTVRPAYKCSKIVDIAQQENIEFSQALEEDMEKEFEISQYSVEQLSRDLRVAMYNHFNLSKDDDCWIVDIYLDAQEVISEIGVNGVYKYYMANYKMENGGITLDNVKEAQKQYVPKEDHDKEISSLASEIVALKEELAQAKTEISEKDGQIIKLGETLNSQKETIAEKDNLIAELEPVKAEMERLQAEKEAKELAEKQANLKAHVLSTKFFSEEEIEASEEMKNAIAELNEGKVNSLIAQKVIAEATKNQEKEEDKKEEKDNNKKTEEKDKEEDDKEISSVVEINLHGNEPIKTTSIADIIGKRRRRL